MWNSSINWDHVIFLPYSAPLRQNWIISPNLAHKIVESCLPSHAVPMHVYLVVWGSLSLGGGQWISYIGRLRHDKISLSQFIQELYIVSSLTYQIHNCWSNWFYSFSLLLSYLCIKYAHRVCFFSFSFSKVLSTCRSHWLQMGALHSWTSSL